MLTSCTIIKSIYTVATRRLSNWVLQ